ncbi:MAG: hypothetical protein EON98_12950 [Chitinophagaceae bacterium]|nr:MAG: hypothetical protein EON98_12950 [Chitinophagaceae bacterium]
MKTGAGRKWWLLLLMPLFMQNVCGKHDDMLSEPDQYITWRMNGTSSVLTVPKDSLIFSRVNNSTSLSATSKPVSNTSIDISFDSPQQGGNYSSSNFASQVNGRYYVQGAAPLSVIVSVYGSSGQYLIGNFSGSVTDTITAALLPVSGEFRIKVK